MPLAEGVNISEEIIATWKPMGVVSLISLNTAQA
jgi:hypothetical protein